MMQLRFGMTGVANEVDNLAQNTFSFFLSLSHFLSKSLSFSLSLSLSFSLLQMKLTIWLKIHSLTKVGSFNYAIDKMVFHDVFLPEKENALKSVLDYDITINRLK